MRIGQSIVYRNLMGDIMNLQWGIDKIDNAVATGNTVNAPSDNSGAATTILTSRNAIEKIAQYQTNLETAETWLKSAEGAMQAMVDALSRAKVLAEQMATGTYDAEQRVAVAEEIDKIINELRVLGNVKVNETYVFGGTRNDITTVTHGLRLPDPVTPTRYGTGTTAEVYNTGTGFSLRFSRDTTGLSSVFQLSGGSTLGQGLGFDFTSNNWTVDQQARNTPARGQILTNNNVFASPATVVSNRIGETLTWLADETAGWQTYRTEGLATVTAAGNIDINGTVINFTDADDLAQQINQLSGLGVTAVRQGADEIRLISQGGIVNLGAMAGVTVDADTTLAEVQAAISNGVQAVGSLTISGGAGFPPPDTDYVRVGDLQATWLEIIGTQPTPATPQDYANYLANWLADQTSEFTAAVSTSGGNATVTITANVPSKEGNMVIESNSVTISTSGSLTGGLDPTGQVIDQPGSIYGLGESNLLYATTVKGQVLDVTYLPNGQLENVLIKLSWIDNDGQLQHAEVNLRDNGENGKVNVPGLGPDFYLHRDGLNYEIGTFFDLNLTHLASNNETIDVSYNTNNHMRYTWTADQVLGSQLRQDMRGLTVSPRNNNTGDGLISLSGYYQGLYSKDLTFDVMESGSVPDGQVIVRVSWVDDQGVSQSETLAIDQSGSGGSAVIPLLGHTPKINLDGERPKAAPQNTGNGAINLLGEHKGLTPCQYTYEIIEAGDLKAPGAPGDNDPVTVRVSWIDDQGLSHTHDLVVESAGEGCAVEIPGTDGMKLYLDPGVYNLNDSFSQDIVMSPDNAAEGIFFQLAPGNYNVGDTFTVHIGQDSISIMDSLRMWSEALKSGDVERAQELSQRALEAIDLAQIDLTTLMADSGSRRSRIIARNIVLDDQDYLNSQTLSDLAEVDITTALLELRMLSTTYNSSLKVISTMSDLFLVNYM